MEQTTAAAIKPLNAPTGITSSLVRKDYQDQIEKLYGLLNELRVKHFDLQKENRELKARLKIL